MGELVRGFYFAVVCERYGNYRDLHVLTHSFPTRRSSDLVPMLQGGQGGHIRHVRGRHVADIVIRHADQIFCVERITIGWRLDTVRDQVVDTLYTCGVDQPAYPFDPHWRGFERHGAPARAGAVADQVDQDADVIKLGRASWRERLWTK